MKLLAVGVPTVGRVRIALSPVAIPGVGAFVKTKLDSPSIMRALLTGSPAYAAVGLDPLANQDVIGLDLNQ